jgi:hypothetical protein
MFREGKASVKLRRKIVRVTGVSAQWLQDDVNAKYAAQPQVADIPVQKN